MKKLIEQLIKFGAVGVIAFIIDYGCLILLTEKVGLNYLLSGAAAFCVSVVFNYVLSIVWVFDTDNKKHSGSIRFAVFIILSIVGLGLTELFLWVFTDKAGLDYRLAKIIATAIVMVYNFITRKLFLENRNAGNKDAY